MRSVLSRNLHQHRLWWLVEWRGVASSPPLASILPSVPTQTTHQPFLSLSAVSWGEEGWGDRLTWDEQYGITRAQKLLGREGEPAFFLLVLYYFFPKTIWSLLCLIAPDTDCVHMEVSLSTWVGVCLLSSFVLFKLFDDWERGKEKDQHSNKDNSTL